MRNCVIRLRHFLINQNHFILWRIFFDFLVRKRRNFYAFTQIDFIHPSSLTATWLAGMRKTLRIFTHFYALLIYKDFFKIRLKVNNGAAFKQNNPKT